MKQRNKKTIAQQYRLWWKENGDAYRAYRYNCWTSTFHFFNPMPIAPDLNPFPKLKKKQLHPKDYNYYNKCPKWWNKTYHIRPVRREWKRFCRTVSELPRSIIEDDEPIADHISLGMPYPSHKFHMYYW